jgi:hypothetical protein
MALHDQTFEDLLKMNLGTPGLGVLHISPIEDQYVHVVLGTPFAMLVVRDEV